MGQASTVRPARPDPLSLLPPLRSGSGPGAFLGGAAGSESGPCAGNRPVLPSGRQRTLLRGTKRWPVIVETENICAFLTAFASLACPREAARERGADAVSVWGEGFPPPTAQGRASTPRAGSERPFVSPPRNGRRCVFRSEEFQRTKWSPLLTETPKSGPSASRPN